MEDVIDRYRQSTYSTAETWLRGYINRLRSSSRPPPKTKEVNDAVWQTIVLQPFEVLILDSPLLQRLRGIRQLGVAHWVYPCAGHTRHEHSIGAVHQVQRLVDSMNRHHPELGSTAVTIPPNWKNLLRLAALVHDVGHGLMSHVSENALRSDDTVDDLRSRLSNQLDLDKTCSLSEAAAHFLVGSPAFRDLVEVAAARTKHPLPDEPAVAVQNAILGRVIHDEFPLLQELISGPYDADKLDYMSRDAHASGVPTVTDIPRLVQKVRLVPTTRRDLPAAVAQRVAGTHTTYFMTAIAISGARTLDELMLGRTLLFDKIYRHQKVRATEAMVSVILAPLAQALGERSPLLPLLLDDDDIVDLDEDLVRRKLNVTIDNTNKGDFENSFQLSGRLRDRDIFVRAFAFSPYLPRDPLRFDDTQRAGYERAAREVEQPESREELLSEIVGQTEKMQSLVQQELPSTSPRGLIALDPPSKGGEISPIARAFLVTADNKLLPFKEDSPESSPLVSAYLLAKDVGYVFCAPEFANAVFLACEYVFRTKYGIRIPPSVAHYAKVDSAAVGRLRSKLSDKQFYKGGPPDLLPEPKRLQAADVEGLIEKVTEKLGIFEGLSTEAGKEGTVRVDASRVRAWLRQFRSDDDINCAISFLLAIRVLSRGDVHESVRAFMRKNPSFQGAYVCPLGGLKDSSHHVAYYVQDLVGEFGFEIVTLSEALGAVNRPILFIDDFIGSGGQAETIVASWFGDKGPLDEDHGPPLGETARNEIRSRSLGFAFTGGDAEGLVRLNGAAAKYQLNVVGTIHLEKHVLPRAFDSNTVDWKDENRKRAFQDTCARIGRQLLRTGSSKPRTEDWIEDRKLGYGNNAYLVAFPYNVPTQTLTLLWQSGTVDGWAWLPLLPRREKK